MRGCRPSNARGAFTFVELLIVVAAVALLGLVAFGSFTRASLQGDVALAQSRMGSLSNALEAYKVDNGVYPACHRSGYPLAPLAEPHVLERLSTPVAYLADSLLLDPFPVAFRKSSSTGASQAVEIPTAVVGNEWSGGFNYQAWNNTGRSQTVADGFAIVPFAPASAYLLESSGPAATFHAAGGILANDILPDGPVLLIYDPTNGSMSAGGIFCVGGAASSTPGYAAGAGLLAAAPSCAASPSMTGESWAHY